jgi:hypothetical protein
MLLVLYFRFRLSMTISIALFVPRYFLVTFVLGWRVEKRSLGEITLAVLGLNIVDVDLCDRGSGRTSVQVLLELVQSTAITLGLTSDLNIQVSIIKYVEGIRLKHTVPSFSFWTLPVMPRDLACLTVKLLKFTPWTGTTSVSNGCKYFRIEYLCPRP